MKKTTQTCSTLRRLSKDKDPKVRVRVAAGNIPKECACEIYGELGKDTEAIGRPITVGYKSGSQAFAMADISTAQQAVAISSRLPKKCACDILTRIGESGDDYVVFLVGDNVLFDACIATDEEIDAQLYRRGKRK